MKGPRVMAYARGCGVCSGSGICCGFCVGLGDGDAAGSGFGFRAGLGVGEVVSDGDGDADTISVRGVFLLGKKLSASPTSEIRAAIAASAIALFEMCGLGDFSMLMSPFSLFSLQFFSVWYGFFPF